MANGAILSSCFPPSFLAYPLPHPTFSSHWNQYHSNALILSHFKSLNILVFLAGEQNSEALDENLSDLPATMYTSVWYCPFPINMNLAWRLDFIT